MWVYYSMEIGVDGLRFAGGLGILAGDILLQCEKAGVEFYGVTLFYPVCQTQTFEGSFTPKDNSLCIFNPKEIGFEQYDDIKIFVNDDDVSLDVYLKRKGSANVLALYEPGLGELYQGERNSDHRLYQEVVLGFGGHMALKRMRVQPRALHLNESATVFAALAELDDLCKENDDLFDALKIVRSKTIFTNHTLVQAAVGVFSRDQIERFVFPNIRSGKVRDWVLSMIEQQKGELNLSTLALALAGHINSVSKLHGRIATGQFFSSEGKLVDFRPITNGIFMDRWVNPDLLAEFRRSGVIGDDDMPAGKVDEALENLQNDTIQKAKRGAREDLRRYLSEKRVDQYGNKIEISETSKIISWARRLVDYKRPKMIFDKPDSLAHILDKHDIYILISGKSHPGDDFMKEEIRNILSTTQHAPILEKRVFYIQDYDDEVAYKLVTGSDAWLNTPIVGKEACGTSIWKAIANLTILISTVDGGAADIDSPSFIPIEGDFLREEVDSLYAGIDRSGDILSSDDRWGEFVKKQLGDYIPIISGARMINDYLDFV